MLESQHDQIRAQRRANPLPVRCATEHGGVTLSAMNTILNAAASPLCNVFGFVLHFVEMSIAMIAGMLLFMAIPGVMQLPEALHLVGMALAMTLPMIGWMRVRGHGWRHGIEMSLGMLLPWAAVLALVGLGATTVMPWLKQAEGPAMFLGMLAVMLLRPGHYAHAHHHAQNSGPIGPADPVCGMAIDPTSASRTTEYQGQTYYFCAPGCRKSFLQDPARFLAADYAAST